MYKKLHLTISYTDPESSDKSGNHFFFNYDKIGKIIINLRHDF